MNLESVVAAAGRVTGRSGFSGLRADDVVEYSYGFAAGH
jgi:hypothetical protein